MSPIIEDPEPFFANLVPRRDNLLIALEGEAEREGIPIVGPVVGGFLEILVRAAGARRVLELGCATGYSAIFLARGLPPEEGKVLTVEKSAAMAERAATNFASAGVSQSIEILQGEALSVLDGLDGPMDFVFLDIDKEAYLDTLPACRRLLRPGGLLVADNTAFPGAVPFVEALNDAEGWQAVHLFSFLPGHSPERDGLSVAQKIS
jgi:predicted O-methyltransferase YrrM